MCKTMVRVIVALLIVLGFNACSTKEIHVEKVCELERPVRVTPKEAICAGIKNTKERELCTSRKYLSLEKDYEAQSAYIDACVK